MNHYSDPSTQSGAALIVGLILLMVLTILAVSGMGTATTGLALANNNAYYENAFQAAESGIEEAIAKPDTTWTGCTTVLPERALNEAGDTVETEVTFRASGPVLELDATSLNAFSALHYDANATGESFRGALAEHRQGFYYVAPKSGTWGAADFGC